MLKRTMDVLVAFFLLLILSPILIMLVVCIRIKLGSPIFFTQLRPGLHGKPFLLIKFRTMLNTLGEDGQLLPDAVRLTAFGRFLRSTSLDELPELWNVLKGEMSLVGPRPLLMEYLPLYTTEQARRHDMRPGITGQAQVAGRNALSWEAKFEQDVLYIQHQSLRLDLKILFLTIKTVFFRQGIQAAGQVTAEKFKGSTVCEL